MPRSHRLDLVSHQTLDINLKYDYCETSTILISSGISRCSSSYPAAPFSPTLFLFLPLFSAPLASSIFLGDAACLCFAAAAGVALPRPPPPPPFFPTFRPALASSSGTLKSSSRAVLWRGSPRQPITALYGQACETIKLVVFCCCCFFTNGSIQVVMENSSVDLFYPF